MATGALVLAIVARGAHAAAQAVPGVVTDEDELAALAARDPALANVPRVPRGRPRPTLVAVGATAGTTGTFSLGSAPATPPIQPPDDARHDEL